MILAARIKKGMARRGKLNNPADIRSGRISNGISFNRRKKNEHSNIENATEQLMNSKITKRTKKRVSSTK